MSKKYLNIAPGISRPCDHGDHTKIWEKKYQYLKVCWQCGRFWHIISHEGSNINYTLDVFDDNMHDYKMTIFFPYPPVNYAKY